MKDKTTRKLLLYCISIILIITVCLILVLKWNELKEKTVQYFLFSALKKSNHGLIAKPELRTVPEGLIIYIDGTNISDFSPIANFECFALGIGNMKAQKNLNFLGVHDALKDLSIDDTGDLRDISFLKYLKLETLFLYAPEIADISPISDLPLQYLVLQSDKLINLNPIKNLSSLKKLYISGPFSRIDFLAELPQLEKLTIKSDNVADFSIIKGLENLKILIIRSNKLKELSFLENLKNLTWLDIDAGDETTLDFDSVKLPPKVNLFRYNKNGVITDRKMTATPDSQQIIELRPLR